MGDFLLGVLQQMAFICYLTESPTCFKFSLWKPKHLSFKRIFVANLIFIRFLFDYLFKNDLFSVNETFVLKNTYLL